MTVISKVKVFRIGPTQHEPLYSLIENLTIQMTYIYYQNGSPLVPLLLLFQWRIFIFATVFV